jgi:hypothetical protein
MDTSHIKRSLEAVQRATAPRKQMLFLVISVGLVAALSGCGNAQGDEENSQAMFRTPHPTFTPTAVVGAAAQNSENVAAGSVAESQEQPLALAPAEMSDGAPRAVVNAPLVNVRTGPGTDTNVVAVVERGAEYDIVGRSDDDEWWQICCQDDQQVWIARDFVDTDGAVDSVPTGGSAAPAIAPGSAPAVSAPSPGLGGSANSGRYELIAKEQFPEANIVRVYLYVYDGTEALPGFTLRIMKDGREVPVSATSFGGQPAFTWPFQDARQRYQNLKIELPNETPAGAWTVQLIAPDGSPVGPPADFSLANNDPQRELYVRYERVQ